MPNKQSPFTVSRQATVDERRRYVASMRLRGLTQREIERELPRLKVVNPRTGKPWSLGTVNADLQAIHERWMAEATQAIAEHKANLLAELRELKRAAWADKDYQAILKAIARESKILGAEAPVKLEHFDLSGAALDSFIERRIEMLARGAEEGIGPAAGGDES